VGLPISKKEIGSAPSQGTDARTNKKRAAMIKVFRFIAWAPKQLVNQKERAMELN
jgi:hypothetical protein